MELKEVIDSYNTLIESEHKKLKKLKSQIFQIGSVRLAVVVLCAFAVYYFWFDIAQILISILVAVVIFLVLMKYHSKLFYKKRYCELLIENAENELKGIEYDFSAFDGAPEKANGSHSFSIDLDLFGEHSFFQSINRTVTEYGKEDLVEKFLNPNDKKEKIIIDQTIVKELSEKKDFLDIFRVCGQISQTEHLDIKSFVSRFADSKPLSKSLWRFMPIIPPFIILFYLVISNILGLPSALGGVVYTLLLLLGLLPMKWIVAKMNVFEKRMKSLETYSELFQVIEKGEFHSPELIDLQNKIRTQITASRAIKKLQVCANNLAQSQNIAGLFVLNPLLSWHIIYAIKVEKWLAENKENIDQWFDALGQFESYVSLAIFAYNHPEYNYPEVADNFVFEAKELGHPMIKREVCVTNDVEIAKHPYFLVVTGANMAGKSTYLRTVGLNLVLACVGAPVFAQSLTFYPFHLVTNLRTSDSLTDNESYFFAELKRLKMIIDRLESGEQLFIILDEILKGTNSEDKQKGSIALMRQLVANKGCGIIATHDLILGNLEKEYPDQIKNFRFEADIAGNNLTFSYKIREGVAQNMNACFLMSKMGITGLD